MSDADALDWIARSGARAKGRRPAYFDDPAVDRLLSMVLALAGELAAARERLDTLERLLEAQGGPAREAIERYTPDAEAARARALLHRELIARVLRPLQQELEAMRAEESAVEEVMERLREL